MICPMTTGINHNTQAQRGMEVPQYLFGGLAVF
jgi:hypothetical protein